MARIKRKVKKWKAAARKYDWEYEARISVGIPSCPKDVKILKKKIRKLARRK
jgi:hypothetical protein